MSLPRPRSNQRGDTAVTLGVEEERTGMSADETTTPLVLPTGNGRGEGAAPLHHAVTFEGQLRPIRPYAAFKRNAGYRHLIEDEDDERHKPRRSFCRSWCEMWFFVAQSRISCAICIVTLFAVGTAIILATSLSGVTDCQPLTGANVFCFILAILGFSLACLCCCYHWVREDEDLPFAIFCTAYCLLLLFVFSIAAGSTAVYTELDVIVDGNYTHDGHVVQCQMTVLPVVIMALSYLVGFGFLMMASIAFVLAMGATV